MGWQPKLHAKSIHTGIGGIVLRLVEGSQWACKVKHVEAWLQGKEDVDRFLVSNS
jgi:hypothetical protein